MLKKQSVSEQAASYLREALAKHRWTDVMPGRDRLAKELGVHGSTVERALAQLEKEGLLKTQGVGRRRLVVKNPKSAPGMRVCVMLYQAGDVRDEYVLELQHLMKSSDHDLTIAPRSMQELKFDPSRIETMVKKHPADAWIIYAGSRQVLERLSKLPIPIFALFGRMSELSIAGCGMESTTALRESIDCLHERGHRRIVMLTRAELIETGLGLTESVFIDKLKELNLPHGRFNLPYWDNSPSGLEQCLSSLFKVTPPSAIFVDEWMLYYATQDYLMRKRGASFRNVSCIPMDYHPSFDWCRSGIPHFYWDPKSILRRTLNWVNSVARGKEILKQKLFPTEFRGREALTVAESSEV